MLDYIFSFFCFGLKRCQHSAAIVANIFVTFRVPIGRMPDRIADGGTYE